LSAVFFYISGHGFGHASRQIEIINALGAASPSTRIVVRTSAPAWLFTRTARTRFEFIQGACDTGVVQLDSLRLDERATIQSAMDFYRTLPQRAEEEAVLLRTHDAAFVISDAPPLGCSAAAAAGIPSVVVSNFTWDWIYEYYPEHLVDAPQLLPVIRDAYRRAGAAWRLPMHGGFGPFDQILDVPFVARHARHDRAEVRKVLGLPAETMLVLSSFGGYGVNDFDPASLDCLDRYAVVFTERAAGSKDPALHGAAGSHQHRAGSSDPAAAGERRARSSDPAAVDLADRPGGRRAGSLDPAVLDPRQTGIFVISEDLLYGSGLRYEDLVAAVDVVVTKPGYGIIAECVANRTAMLYTSRGHFVEYDVLVKEMPRVLRCEYLDQESLLAGRWRAALDRLVTAAPPPERPATNGAEVVAEMICSALRDA
jgi:hypothetical protein